MDAVEVAQVSPPGSGLCHPAPTVECCLSTMYAIVAAAGLILGLGMLERAAAFDLSRNDNVSWS